MFSSHGQGLSTYLADNQRRYNVAPASGVTQDAVVPFGTHVAGGMHVWVTTHIVSSLLHVSIAVLSVLQRWLPAVQTGGLHVAVEALHSAAVAQGVPLCQLPL